MKQSSLITVALVVFIGLGVWRVVILDQATPTSPVTVQSSNSRISVTPRRSVLECSPRQHRDWSNQCARIIAYAEVMFPPAELPTKLTISYNGGHVRLFGMVPTYYHLKFYTDELPVLASIAGAAYVADRSFFNENFPPVLAVGDVIVPLSWDGQPHWAASKSESDRLVAAFKDGSKVDIEYAHLGWGKGQRSQVSLLGFTAALQEFRRTEPRSTTQQQVDPSRIIAKMIAGNRLAITGDDLKTLSNPNGAGHFVYVPQTRFYGVERLFIWFVNGGHVVKLNGATHTLTPNVPYPRSADYDIWQGTGFKPADVTTIGLGLAFGR